MPSIVKTEPHPFQPGVLVSRQRVRQLLLQAEGRCTQCGRKRGKRGTTNHCRPCADRHNALTLAAYHRRRRQAKAEGR